MTPQVIKPYSQGECPLTVSPAPHWHSGRTIQRFMLWHVLALLPAIVMGVVYFGLDAVRVMALAMSVSVAVEALCRKMTGRQLNIDDYSALYTGLLLAFLLPPTAPFWLVAIGAAFAVILGRIVFGGHGANPFCAPLVAWAILKVSWPDVMDIDLSMTHTILNEPLSQLKGFGAASLFQFDYKDLVLGRQIGGLGSVQILPLFIGGVFLILMKQVRIHIPAAFLGGVMVTAGIFYYMDPGVYAPPLFHLLTGSVIFGAFFLAVDTASTPVGHIPMILFGLIAGIMVMIIRVYGIFPDGVPFAILLANLLSPLLDRIRPKPFGAR